MTTSDASGARGVRHGALFGVEALAFTLLSWGIWLVSLSVVDTEDLLVGGLAAVVCGVVAAGTRRAIGTRWRPRLDVLRPLVLWPVALAADSAAVLTLPLRRGAGKPALERVDIGASGSSPAARARRAIAGAVATSTPAGVVLDVDETTGTMVVHTIASPGPKLHEAYARR